MQIVREWLRGQEWTQARLASAVGITEAHLSYVLSGRRQPSVALLRRLSGVTGISPTQLLRDIPAAIEAR